MLLAAAERRLGDELDRRARTLIEADDEAFELVVEQTGGLAVAWEGHVLARLAPGRSLLEPALRTARALDRLSAQRRAALRARLEAWLDRSIQGHLGPLKALARTAADPNATAGVRALAAMLVDAAGVIPRRVVASQIATLNKADRYVLGRLKVRLGALDIHVPALLKPGAQHWRAALLAVRAGLPMPRLPAAGMAVLDGDADPRGASLAFRRFGPTWLRIDLAERLAAHAHQVRGNGGNDPVDRALVTSLGLDEVAIGRLMKEVGFETRDGAWRWRGRRPPRSQQPPPPAGHAFAELAKLRR
jgi:ATP-dependent RNA helicase SUPV3L1/SUV3